MAGWSSSTMPCHAPTMRAGLPYQTHGIRHAIRTSHLRLTCIFMHISPLGLSFVPGKLDPKQTLNLPPAAQPVTLRELSSIRDDRQVEVDRPGRQIEVKRETVHIHTCPPPPRRSFPSPSPRPFFLTSSIHLSSIAAASGKFLQQHQFHPSSSQLNPPPPLIAHALALRCSTTPESIGSQIHSFSCNPTIIHTHTHNHSHASRS
jgi:hypothetical protein